MKKNLKTPTKIVGKKKHGFRKKCVAGPAGRYYLVVGKKDESGCPFRPY